MDHTPTYFESVQVGTDFAPPSFPELPGDLLTYAVDFETYYDKECTVKTLGPYNYVRHPKFEAYMVSIYGPGIAYVGHPAYAPWDKISGKGFRWVSHNAGFDEEVQAVLIETGVVSGLAWPEEWHCTADLSAYLGAPRSLAGAMKWFYKIEVSKTVRDAMQGKRYEDLAPEKQREMLDYAMKDAVFCLNDLWLKLSHQWPAHERKLSALTRKMGRRGLRLDVPYLHTSIQKLSEVREEARSRIPWAPADPEDEKGVLSHPKLRDYCKSVNIDAPESLAKDSVECEQWEAKYGAEHPVVAAMRDYRRSNTLLKRLQKMQQRLKPDGRMVYYLKYFGATLTGRWSGDGGINMQNQHKEPFYLGDDYRIISDRELLGPMLEFYSEHGWPESDVLFVCAEPDGTEWAQNVSATIDPRRLIIPDEGKEFLISDSSQIEPRCLAWLAGNVEFLQKVREGYGIYEAFAVAKGRWPAEKKGRLKAEDPDTYKWAKAAVLGLGYGCGKAKFVEVARVLAGLILTPEESAATVDDFRRTEKSTTGLWKKLESSMCCHIGRDFVMQLPSGRKLRYRNVEAEDGGLSAEIVKQIGGADKVVRLRYWGGMLTENITQATARECLAAILLRLDAAGHDVVLHVHDEVVLEVPRLPEAERADLMAKVESIMSATPGFMKGLPLACESQFADHYLK